MTYLKRNDLSPVPDSDWQTALVVEIDAGVLVRLDSEIKAAGESMTPIIRVRARQVEADLQPVLTSQGGFVQVEFKHNASQYEQDQHGTAAIMRECLLLVLGEPLTLGPPADPPGEEPDASTLIPWPPELARSVDIRRAIAIASETVDMNDVL